MEKGTQGPQCDKTPCSKAMTWQRLEDGNHPPSGKGGEETHRPWGGMSHGFQDGITWGSRKLSSGKCSCEQEGLHTRVFSTALVVTVRAVTATG